MSRSSSPIPLEQRTFARLPKRARLSAPTNDSDPSSTSSLQEPHTPPELDATDGLFGSARDGHGKQTLEDELYPGLFSEIGQSLRLAAQATTLFGPAFRSEVDEEYDSVDDGDSNDYYEPDYHAPPPGKTREKPSTAAERAKQQAALEALFEDDRDRVTPGSNKKKRKVPGLAQQGPASAAERDERDRDLDDTTPVAPARATAGTDVSDRDTALRSDFASAMVGVVKALGPTFASVASKVPPGKRAPYSARVQRTGYVSLEARDDARARSVRRKIASTTAVNLRGERDGPPDLVASARALAAGRTVAKRDSKTSSKSKTAKAPAPAPVWPEPVDPDSDIVLPNLYDPRLGPATRPPQRQKAVASVNDAKAQTKRAITWQIPDGSSPDFTFACSVSPLVLSRLDELEAERVKVRRARALLLERAKELEAARRDVAAASGALATTSAGSGALAKRKSAGPAKTYATKSTQTEAGPPMGCKIMRPRSTTNAPPVHAPPVPPPQKGKNTKGKKKRAAHANANNAHHRDNYVPSRLPGANQQARDSSYGTGEQLGLVDPNSAFNPHPQLGNSPLVPSFAALDEWLCGFCETRILYGSQATLTDAIRKRKAVLKVRKRAQDRAKKAADGHGPSKPARAPPTRVSAGTQTD